MSVHISSLVWKDKGTTGNTRMLLLALADMANDEGICWPSVSTLRSRLNLGTDRAIQQILSNLESNGYIVKQQRSGHSNVYKINPTPEQSFTPECTFTPEQPFTPPLNVRSPHPRTAIHPTPEQPFTQNRNRTVNEPPLEPLVFVAQGAPTANDAPLPAENPQTQRASKGTRIPQDFTPSPEMLEWAKQNRPGVDLLDETDKFCDYWRSSAGSRAVKMDWQLTWKTWIRNATGSPQQRPSLYAPKPTMADKIKDLERRHGEKLIQELDDLGYPARTNRDPLAAIK